LLPGHSSNSTLFQKTALYRQGEPEFPARLIKESAEQKITPISYSLLFRAGLQKDYSL
jgi:hypothetical protein